MSAADRPCNRGVPLLVLSLALNTAACVRNNSAADLRGTGAGWEATVKLRADVPLSPEGARVAVVDPAGALRCRHIGDVSGVVARRGIRPAGADRAATLSTMSREGAVHDARNVAAAHQADAIVIDADELWETGRMVVLYVHGRALRCR